MPGYQYVSAFLFAVLAGVGVSFQAYPFAAYCALMVVINVGDAIASVIKARDVREDL